MIIWIMSIFATTHMLSESCVVRDMPNRSASKFEYITAGESVEVYSKGDWYTVILDYQSEKIVKYIYGRCFK